MSAIIFYRKLKFKEVKELPLSFGQKLRQPRLTFRFAFPQKALLTCAGGCPENAKPGVGVGGWLGEARPGTTAQLSVGGAVEPQGPPL